MVRTQLQYAFAGFLEPELFTSLDAAIDQLDRRLDQANCKVKKQIKKIAIEITERVNQIGNWRGMGEMFTLNTPVGLRAIGHERLPRLGWKIQLSSACF